MQCPRCNTPITSAPDPGGHMTCPGCGARLLSRPARQKPADSTPASGTTASSTEDDPAAATLASAPARKAARPGADTAPSTGRRPARPPVAPEQAAPSAPPPSPSANLLEQILAEIRTLRGSQQEILRLLQAGPSAPPTEAAASSFEGLRPEAAHPPAIRSRRRKSVLLIDDDAASREAAMAAFEQAEVPARSVSDGRGGVEAIAEEKPDVIVLELSLHGEMAGKDVINMIKATMEWVDIPIVLYTRAPVESQKEARTIHGADEVVLKQHGPTALVARVINLFRSR